MLCKKEAIKLRTKELKKKWKKKYFKQTLQFLPIRFQKHYKSYKVPAKSKIQSRYIHGEAGTGKTVLACFLFIQAVKEFYFKRGYYPNISAHFVNFPDLINDLQRGFKDNTHHQLYQEYLTCDILVLDDLGAKKTTDWVGDIVYHIINRRYENELFSLLTSNKNISELANTLNDDRTVRRIEETYQITKKKHFNKS